VVLAAETAICLVYLNCLDLGERVVERSAQAQDELVDLAFGDDGGGERRGCRSGEGSARAS
jgi:hypothetical protein